MKTNVWNMKFLYILIFMYLSLRVMPSHVTENVMSYLVYIGKDHNENKLCEN